MTSNSERVRRMLQYATVDAARARVSRCHACRPGSRRRVRTPRPARPGSRRAARGPRPAGCRCSCAAVRAPTIGAVTPGRSRTQASATSSGRQPEPVGGGRDRLHDALRTRRRGTARRTRRSAGRPRGSRRGCRRGTCRSARHGRAGTRGGARARAPCTQGRPRARSRAAAGSTRPACWRAGPGRARPAARSRRARSASRSSWRSRRSASDRSRLRRRARPASRRAASPSSTCGPARGRRGRCRAGPGSASRASSRARRDVSTTALAADRAEHAGLGGEDDVAARDHAPEQRPEDRLARAVAVGRGGVDQGAAGLDEERELLAGLVLVGVAAPGHRAEAQPRHAQTGPAQRSLLHAVEAIEAAGANLAATRAPQDERDKESA